MKSLSFFIFLFFAVLLFSIDTPAQDNSKSPVDDINIQYQKFVLDNGLTVIIHEDHKAPVAALNIWYHVGSKNEKPGKTGFAHLFEHLMFTGSENFKDNYFQAMERIGATDLNGTTSSDRTNYFENVPTSAFDIALWMESDRMGHLLGSVDQARLDQQRGVVQNEKRQGEDQPYGITDELITKSTYPAGHPYSWTVIGSMEDLSAASLDDVKEWFKTYYGPSNVVLVVAGDVNTQDALEKVKKYFGDIPAGPPTSKQKTWIAKRTGSQQQVVQDRVPQPRIFKVWNVPEWGSKESTQLDLLSSILTSGKTSRLYKRLVYDEQVATRVSSYIDDREIGGQFYIDVMLKPGQDVNKISKEIDEDIAKILQSGPTEKELEKAKTEYFANFIRGIERIGGFGGKSDILARSMTYKGNPDYYKVVLSQVKDATVEDIQNTAKDWLSDGVYELDVLPFATYSVTGTDADRTHIPNEETAPEVKFPDIRQFQLSNGLKVLLAERHSIPVVNCRLIVDAGYAADQNSIPGTAKLAMGMIDEGTKNRTALQISDDLNSLGAWLSAYSSLDNSVVSLSALKSNLDASLDIFSDVILNPTFPEDDLSRLKKQQIVDIQQEKATPILMAIRVLPGLLYGSNHAYGNPLTGSGFENGVAKISREDLTKFYNAWFKPNNATLVVVGDITENEIKPKLEKLFNNWKPGELSKKEIGKVEQSSKPRVYILDRPGSAQSVVIAGDLAVPKNNPDEVAIQTMIDALGGTFTSRINMNIREDKHWSYGAHTVIIDARGQRTLVAYAPVQTDKTKETMIEINKELTDVTSTRPINNEEFMKNKKNTILSLPGQWETMNSVLGSISSIVEYSLPTDYYQKYSSMVQNLTLEQVDNSASQVVSPQSLVWVIVGDRSKIEEGIKSLNYGEIKFLDGDGNIVE